MPIDPTTLSQLIEAHWGPLLVWVGPEGSIAEDIVQECFIRLSREHPVPTRPVAWLYTVARRLAINERLARTRRRRREQSSATHAVGGSSAWKTLEARELADQLQRLDPELREIVVARVWGDLSFDEIAEATGKSKATVWRIYGLALSKLREIYGVTCETKRH